MISQHIKDTSGTTIQKCQIKPSLRSYTNSLQVKMHHVPDAEIESENDDFCSEKSAEIETEEPFCEFRHTKSKKLISSDVSS